MTAMKTELLTACDHLPVALLNGVFQGTIVALVVGVVLRWCRRTNAATRHAVWCGTLLLLAGLIPAQYWPGDPLLCPRFLIGSSSPVAIPETVPVPGDSPVSFQGPAAAEPVPGISVAKLPEDEWRPDPLLEFLVPQEAEDTGLTMMFRDSEPASIATAPVLETPPPALPSGIGSLETPVVKASGWSTRSIFRPIYLKLTAGTTPVRILSLALLAVWGMVAGVRFVALGWRLYQIHRLRTTALPPPEGLSADFRKLCGELKLDRKVDLKVSLAHRSPLLLGFSPPVVLLPADDPHGLDSAQLHQVLRHELAHVRRRDDWTNLAQHFMQAAFFFHPAIWWVSRQISLEREIACDDQVLQQGGRPRAYALVLAEYAARAARPVPMLAPGVSTSKRQLQQRINMILNTHRNTSPGLAKTRLGIITGAASLIAVLGLYAAPRLALAQTSTLPPAALASGGSGITSTTSGGGTTIFATSSGQHEVPGTPTIASGGSGITFSSSGAATIIAASSDLPELPDGDVDEPGVPAPPTPADVPPGPKAKPGKAPRAPRAVILAPPADPAHAGAGHTIVVAPSPPQAANLTRVPARIPRSPDGAMAGAQMEERLRRLEQMMESLVAQQNRNRVAGPAVLGDLPMQNLTLQQKEFALQQKEIAEMRAKVDREVDQAKRAMKEAEKARKRDDERRVQALKSAEDGSQVHLEELRRQREALGRELEKLDRQIQRLEQGREQLDKDKQSFLEPEEDICAEAGLLAETSPD
jgi:beta-lactamase regulating signal transducer with metallopeptidase domain